MYNYSDLSNEELFKLIANKDIEGMSFIYDKYSPGIYGVIVQKVATRQEANNILYDTFVTGFKGLSSYSLSTTIFVYFYHIAISYINKRNVLYMIHPESNTRSSGNASKKIS
jgi:hypothetical protein